MTTDNCITDILSYLMNNKKKSSVNISSVDILEENISASNKKELESSIINNILMENLED